MQALQARLLNLLHDHKVTVTARDRQSSMCIAFQICSHFGPRVRAVTPLEFSTRRNNNNNNYYYYYYYYYYCCCDYYKYSCYTLLLLPTSNSTSTSPFTSTFPSTSNCTCPPTPLCTSHLYFYFCPPPPLLILSAYALPAASSHLACQPSRVQRSRVARITCRCTRHILLLHVYIYIHKCRGR